MVRNIDVCVKKLLFFCEPFGKRFVIVMPLLRRGVFLVVVDLDIFRRPCHFVRSANTNEAGASKGAGRRPAPTEMGLGRPKRLMIPPRVEMRKGSGKVSTLNLRRQLLLQQ